MPAPVLPPMVTPLPRSPTLSPSSRGPTLATASWDKTVQLWDSGTGERLGTLQGHQHQVYSVAFSPDGRTVASGSWDNTVRLWDAHTGKPLRILKGHSAIIRALAFSPDGTRLASGSKDHTIRIWEPSTGKYIRSLLGHTDEVEALAFSPDGSVLASGAWDHTVCLWSSKSGDQLRSLQGHKGSVGSVAFSPDGKILASASEDKTVRLWECITGEHDGTLHGHTMGVTGVAFAPNGRILATASRDKTVRLWNPESCERVRTLEGHTHWVSAVAFSPNGFALASASWDKTVRLWDTGSWENVRTIQGFHKGAIDALAFAPKEVNVEALPPTPPHKESKMRKLLGRFSSSKPVEPSLIPPSSSSSTLSESDALSISSEEEGLAWEIKTAPPDTKPCPSWSMPRIPSGPVVSPPRRSFSGASLQSGEMSEKGDLARPDVLVIDNELPGSQAGGVRSESNHPPECVPGGSGPSASQEASAMLSRRAVLFMTEDLEQATGCWSKENLLGDGAFGSVYKGIVNGNLQVAIKRMKESGWEKSGLVNELQALSSLRHPHIVALLGFCPDRQHPSLVYEYLPGGDLRCALDPQSNAAPLSPLDRIRIAKEVAAALQHLHQGGFQHRDLKPGNILLDEHRKAKLGDWGLAFHSESTVQVYEANGTPGYVAPEILLEGKFSPASDVYAFGVILLQLLTGFLKARELHSLKEQHRKASLQDLEPEHLLGVLDAKAGAWPPEAMGGIKKVVAIALQCVARDRIRRPCLVDIYACLDGCITEMVASAAST